jgi:signal recognition particle receptor subunit alpha
MLDTFEILTTSGVVLWSRTYAPVGANVINSLIRDVFIEERILPQPEDAGSKPTYKKEGYTLKWTASKDVGLIFVVCNPNQFTTARVLVARLHGTQDKYAHTSEYILSVQTGSIPKSCSLDMDRQAS